jgi:hypothetical protein
LYGHAANVLSMEALAVGDGVKLDGVKLANVLGFSRIEVETDASEVVKHGRTETRIYLQLHQLSRN